ncbi:hypothetical protein HPB50_008077 [Hyalomma asiaticum]|uniref:Uncharacterized protein n=1 Tax=Hyalomma asiaticum TaxID=266040 RepID=A0ACB7RYN1_HYAAI|nr:hypothetical protein HPB50_008077 [Hyalomma asiaticum]
MRWETRFNGCSPISVDINASLTNWSNWSNQIKQRRSLVPLLPLFSPRFQSLSFGAAKLGSCCAVAFLAMSSPGPSVKKKRRQFLLKEKVDILTELNAGKKQVDICRERDIAPSTVATILKDQEKIVKLHRESQLAPSRKRLRLGNYQTVDDAVLTWFKDARQHGVPCQALLFKERRDSSRSLWAPPASMQVPDGSIGSGKGMASCGKSRSGKKRRPMPKVRLPGGTSAFRKSSSRSVQTTFSTPTKRRAFISCYLIRQ